MRTLITTVFFCLFFHQQNLAYINSITLSSSSLQNCDSVLVTISGTHTCPGDSITGVVHSVSGSTIIMNVSVNTGFCIPPPSPPSFSVTYTLPLAAIPTGSYTVTGNYNTIQASSTASLTLTTCCPNQARAGKDTSVCDVSAFQLNANTVGAGATSMWSIISGSGSLNNSSLANAVLSNLSFGTNTLVWTTSDTICTTSDTISIENFESASAAVTEADKVACKDTVALVANNITVGTGSWKPLQLGAFIFGGSGNPSTMAKLFLPNTYNFTWTVSNGACVNVDTLTVDYAVLDSAPVISESNLVLTSTTVPKYQWYKDGLAIPGATNKTYNVTSSGLYKVLGMLVNCNNGLFSNEIEISSVGILESREPSEIMIVPNPAGSVIRISGLDGDDVISIYQNDMKLLLQKKSLGDEEHIDVSGLNNGLYLLRVESKNRVLVTRLVVQH